MLLCFATCIHAEISPGVEFGSGDLTYTTERTLTNLSIRANSSGVYLNDSLLTQIDLASLSLQSLGSGNQTYTAQITISPGLFAPSSCFYQTHDGNLSLSGNETDCSGVVTMSQAAENRLVPTVLDEWFSVSTTPSEGVEVLALSGVMEDEEGYSDLETLRFLKNYTLNNSLGSIYENLTFSPTLNGINRKINLSIGESQKNGSYAVDGLLAVDNFTIPGTVFNLTEAYNVYQGFDFNNTLTETLPIVKMALALDHFSASPLAEEQDGILWPDLAGQHNGTHFLFNLTSLAPGKNQSYRYSYDSFLGNYSGESSADYRLSGEYKEWTLDRNYELFYNLTDKILTHTIFQAELGEWVGKSASWTSRLWDESGSEVDLDTTDNIDMVDISFTVPSWETYIYQMRYYTPLSGGGGGGGGGAAPVTVSTVSEEEITEIVKQTTTKKGYLQFYQLTHERAIASLPTEVFEQEVMVVALGGPVNATVAFTNGLEKYLDAYICDVRTDKCYTNLLIEEGERKYVYIYGNLTSEEFETDFLEQEELNGQLVAYSYGIQTDSAFNLTIRKAFLFDATKTISEDLAMPHKLVASLTYFLITAIVILVVFFVGKSLVGA